MTKIIDTNEIPISDAAKEFAAMENLSDCGAMTWAEAFDEIQNAVAEDRGFHEDVLVWEGVQDLWDSDLAFRMKQTAQHYDNAKNLKNGFEKNAFLALDAARGAILLYQKNFGDSLGASALELIEKALKEK